MNECDISSVIASVRAFFDEFGGSIVFVWLITIVGLGMHVQIYG